MRKPDVSATLRKRWYAFSSLPWWFKPFVLLGSPLVLVMFAGWLIILVFVGLIFAVLIVADPDQL